MKPVLPKPRIRAFALEELAFFWNPRPWIPDIVARFDWPGTSDVRDAIIMLDDEGGHGFLHWYPDRASWGLTDKGKRWVEDLLSKAKLKRARDWVPPPAIVVPVSGLDDATIPCPDCGDDYADRGPCRPSPEPLEAPEPSVSREDELAALVSEQATDKD